MRCARLIAALLAVTAGGMVWAGHAIALDPGDFDPSFAAGGMLISQLGQGAFPNSQVLAVALQPDGKILAAGSATDGESREQLLVARFNPDGSFDPSFGNAGIVATQVGAGPGPRSAVDAIAVQPDGKILAGGYATDAGGDFVFMLARLNPDGTFDSSFGTGGKVITAQLDAGATPSSEADALALLPDGQILACGNATDATGHAAFLVVRVNRDGGFDPSFGTGGKLLTQLGADPNPVSAAFALAPASDGKIIVGGFATDAAGRVTFLLARLNPGGSPDATFGTSGKVLTQLGAGDAPSSSVNAIALQPDGKILAGGYGTDAHEQPAVLVARLNPDGSFDSTFGTAGVTQAQVAADDRQSQVASLALQPDGKILAVGGADEASGRALFAVRLNSDGSLDATFGTGGEVQRDVGQGLSRLTSTALQPDGKLIVGGIAADQDAFRLLVARLAVYQPSASPTGSPPPPTPTGASQSAGSPVLAAPVISAVKIRPHRFRALARDSGIAARAGAVISYHDSENAEVTFTIDRILRGRAVGHRCLPPSHRDRHSKLCLRYVKLRGSFSHRDTAGANRFHFTGRLRGRPLPPGLYRLNAVADANGRKGQTVHATFRIIR